MKKQLLIIAFISVAQIAFSQMYYRIKITTDNKGLNRLSSLGVTIEHGELVPGKSYTSDFSDWELSQIKKSGIPFEILISDVSSFYKNRNKLPLKELMLQYPLWTTWICTLPATPKNFKLGSMGGFYKYNEMMNTLDSMQKKFPNLVSIRMPISFTQKSVEGRLLQYVRISNNPNTDQQKPKILYTALHHAREPISASQMIFFMWHLLENYSTSSSVKSLVDNVEMFFIPCINPDGYIYNQTINPDGGGMWRKNRRVNADGSIGVDLNRNYSYQFAYDNTHSSPNGLSDTYRGTASFSEPETQLISSFCRRYHFNVVMNHHSYSNYLVYSWGYSASEPNPDANTFSSRAANMTKCNNFKYGTWPAVMYAANGISDDWMYGNQTLKPKAFSFTPETGNSVDGFWPPLERIIPLSAANVDMNLKAAQYARSSAVQ